MLRGGREVIRVWPAEHDLQLRLAQPRRGLVIEAMAEPGRYVQSSGPFRTYERQLTETQAGILERTRYELAIPWFGWLFWLPVRWWLGRGRRSANGRTPDRVPWWAPPDVLDARQAGVLGLLAAAAMSSAFTNTLYSQTAPFAADEFGVGDVGFGIAGGVVRAGIVVALPFAVLADRIGRRRVIRIVAWAAPIVCSLGAIAPSFATLVATQAIGRPLGLALDFLIAVVVAEEMPRNSRAYALSVTAMANGLGAGIAVIALPLADLGQSTWRLIYPIALVWLVVAFDLSRRLPETERFVRPHVIAPPLRRDRFATLAIVAVALNSFVAPAAMFQNRYLKDVRGFGGSDIALFALVTATPAGIGLVVGGKLADVRGRRRLIAVTVPLATALVVLSFSIGGPVMWLAAFGGGFVGGIAYPALAVYRAEMFPTGNRGRAAGLLTAVALLGGIGGILTVSAMRDQGISYGVAIATVALAQAVVVAMVLWRFPETAHHELEELNPEDAAALDLRPG